MLTPFFSFFYQETSARYADGRGGLLFWVTRCKSARFVRWLILGVLWAVAGGCETASQPADSSHTVLPSDSAPEQVLPALSKRESWYSMSILGAKVGYQHTWIEPVEHKGRPAIRCETFSRFRVLRSGAPLVTEIRFFDLTTPEGRLVELGSEVIQGGASLKTQGRVQGDQLVLAIATQGRPQELTLPWKPEYGGFHAVELSLASAPMKPGQTRTLQALVAVVNQTATVELRAIQEETVRLPIGEFRLLRIESTTRFPSGQTFRDTYWIDSAGAALKVHSQAMNAELTVTSRQLAEDPAGLEKLDLALDQAIPVEPRLVRPHQTTRVRYRMHLEQGNPAQVFPQTPYQEVRSVDEHTAELVVWASRPTLPPPKTNVRYEPPGEYDRKPNSFIQSDHPRIAALARQAVGQEKNPRQQALQLERFVHGYLRSKNFSTGFASALEVLQSREGDCTEHAVLLAALARAVGIPARTAIGLVYQDGKFYYHMWNELYVEDRWIAFDATLADGGVGGAHIQLAHSHLHGANAFSAFLPVLNVLGQGLRIELIDQQ